MEEDIVLMQKQDSTHRQKGQHLTSLERGKVAGFRQAGKSNRWIAAEIGVCPQTINNEIKRGTVDQVKKSNGKRVYHRQYLPEAAQARYETARLSCHRPDKFASVQVFLAWYVQRAKQDKWSPDASIGYAKRHKLFTPEELVCASTLYQYIDDQRLEIRNIDLLEKTKRKTSHQHHTKAKRLAGRSIEERPKVVERRRQFGHWEMDTIVGKRNGKESVILTLIERKTRCQLLRLIEGRDADSVSYALRGIKREWGACIKTITADNGPEFTALNTAFAGTETEIFYAHPYTSCDRATNEAHNRMIRQDFPKGMSLDDISPSQVQATQDRLNQLPRKQQGYCTPQQNFEAEARRVRRMAQ